jgi:hypothetical protein
MGVELSMHPYTKINFEKAYAFAKKMQDMSPLEIRPFYYSGDKLFTFCAYCRIGRKSSNF